MLHVFTILCIVSFMLDVFTIMYSKFCVYVVYYKLFCWKYTVTVTSFNMCFILRIFLAFYRSNLHDHK